MPSEYRPRLSIDLTPEQRRDLDRILGQHGLQKAVFSILVDDLINAVNTHGHHVISGLISRAIGFTDIVKEPK